MEDATVLALAQPPPATGTVAEVETRKTTEDSIRSYHCGICNGVFSRPDHLVRHIRTHTLEKPFACSTCGRAFSRADLLRRHACRHLQNVAGRQKAGKEDQDNGPTRVSQACNPCAAAKLRCSEEKPCVRCVRKSLSCEYGKGETALAQGRSRQQRSQPLRDSGAQVDLTSYAPGGSHTGCAHESILHLDLQQPLGLEEGPASQGATASLALASTTLHTDLSNLQQHQKTSQSGLLPEKSIPDALLDRNLHQMGPTQLDLNPQITNTVSVDVVMTGDAIDPPLFSFDENEPLNGPGSLFTEFIKDLIDIPAHDSFEGPARKEPQAPFNMWDTFMTTPEDWTDDLSNLDLDFLKDDFLQDINLHSTQTPTEAAAPEHEERRPSMSMGVKAFKMSFWDWVPEEADCGPAERAGMASASNIPEKLSHYLREISNAFDKHCFSADRARFLELLITNSPKANMLRVISSFPSTTLIDELMQWAMRLLATQTLSWFHVPTFDPQATPAELLACVIAYGACMTPIKEVQRFGYSILETVKSAIIDKWDGDNSKTRSVELLQAYFVLLLLWFWSGNKRKMELAESLEQPLVTVLRKARFLRREHHRTIDLSPDDSADVLMGKWKQWAQSESEKRIAHKAFIHDAHMSMIYSINPLLSAAEMNLPLPDADSLWACRSAEEWKSLYLQQTWVPQPSMTSLVRDALTYHPASIAAKISWAEQTLLYGLWGFVWECRHASDLLQTDDAAGDLGSLLLSSRLDGLANVLQRLQERPNPAGIGSDACLQTSPETDLVHGFLCMNLYVPLKNMQSFAGRYGEEEANRVYASLEEWSSNRQARVGLRHACQIFHAAKQIAPWALHEFHAYAIYAATVTIFGYGLITAARDRKAGHVVSNPKPSTPDWESGNFIWLCSDSPTTIRRFLNLGDGRPVIRGFDNGSTGATRVAYIQSPSTVVDLAIEILKRQPCWTGSSNLPPFSENLIKLLSELRAAVIAVGYG